MNTLVHLRRLALSLMLPLALAMPVANAQPANEWANCQEVTDPDVADRMQLCSAHAGCKLVLKVHKTCTAVRGFMDRLGDSIGQGVKTLFGYRKEIQPDNLWDAAQTDSTRRLDELPSVRDTSATIREGLGKSGKQLLEGRTSAGNSFAYYGDSKDGRMDGWGTMVSSNGAIQRGQFRGGTFDGTGELVTADGMRGSGQFQRGGIQAGAVANSAGSVSEGRFENGRLAEGTFKYADGRREEGRFDTRTQNLTEGSKYATSGELLEKGSFRNGQLEVGERYSNGQVVATVDRPRQEREQTEARQATELERLRRERAEREQAAAERERQFHAELQHANPGQLYALADQWREQGDADKARQALRAMVTRFPDHALTASAVSQLNRLNAAVLAPPASPVTRPTSGGSGSGGGRTSGGLAGRDCVARVHDAMRTAIERGKQQNATFAHGVSGRFEQRIAEMRMEALQLCGNDSAVEQDRRQAQDYLQQLRDGCSPRSIQQLGQWKRAVCDNEFGDPAKPHEVDQHRRFFVLFQEEHNRLMNELRGGRVAPAAPTVAANAGAVPASLRSKFGDPQGDICQGDGSSFRYPGLEQAINIADPSSPTVKIRAAIVGLDVMIDALQRCNPSGTAQQQMLERFRTQRSAALNNCRALVTRDNCLESPF